MMSILLAVVTFICVKAGAADEAITNGTELVLTFLIHRHGDRTPVISTMGLSDDPDALEELIRPYGYGQLTNVGKRRSFEMGKFIRRRYDGLISPQYNSSELYLRSTDSTRAKMTALTAMAGVYPAEGQEWIEDINWVPVPYTTLPAKYDYNLAVLNCPTLTMAKMNGSNSPKMEQYHDSFDQFGQYASALKQEPLLTYMTYDLYCSQISLGLPLKPKLQETLPEIKAAAGEAIDLLFGDDNYIALQAGPFLKDFFDQTSNVLAGRDTQRLRIYSAHDVSVYSWMAVSRVRPKQGVPPYNAVFALELRRVVKTGQFVVLPVYVSSPGEPIQYLQVEGCGSELCDVDKFRELTAPYTLDVKEWRIKCDFDEDVEIDESNI
ncbi:unnamed protein product [Parnassius mnemosyne]|uniref:acid phosphatase n=1 Tax=Parnassius mnemosyne TaxID=213953 RepID=A0AAV1L1T0_9NEOP